MDLTEPDAGSDLQSVMLKATCDEANNCWRLNGVKRFITNGDANLHQMCIRDSSIICLLLLTICGRVSPFSILSGSHFPIPVSYTHLETYSNGVIAWQYPATRTFIGGIQLSF